MKVVSNVTPIISLATIGRISLLHQLFGKATNIKRDTFRHFVPIAIPQSRVEAGFKPAPTGGLSRLTLVAFGKIYIPREVYDELKSKKAPGYQEIDGPYFQVREIQGTPYVGFLRYELSDQFIQFLILIFQ